MKKAKKLLLGAMVLSLWTGSGLTGCADQKLDGQKTAEAGGQESVSEDGNEKDAYQTDPVPKGQQEPVEPEDAEIDESKAQTCYFTISCETLLNNLSDLKDGKEAVVPDRGVIFERSEFMFFV